LGEARNKANPPHDTAKIDFPGKGIRREAPGKRGGGRVSNGEKPELFRRGVLSLQQFGLRIKREQHSVAPNSEGGRREKVGGLEDAVHVPKFSWERPN